MQGLRVAALAAAGVCGVVTSAGALLPQAYSTSRQSLLHVALETSASLIALLAGSLVVGRLRRQGRFNDLVLSSALALLALINIFLLTIPAVTGLLTSDLGAWALLVGRSLAAALFALAAFAPPRALRRPGLMFATWVIAGCAAVMLAAALANAVAGHLAPSLATTAGPDSRPSSELVGPTVLLTPQLVLTVLYGVAALGFLRRSRQLGDEFLGWLGIAAILAAFSYLNHFLYPSPSLQGLYIGDMLRLGAYAILLVGSVREIRSHWNARSEAAVLAERQRIARDLHDGLAQELAYLARNLDSLHGELPKQSDETLGRLQWAVERAQRESRRAVSISADPCTQPVEVALAEATAAVAERFRLGLDLDVVFGASVSAAREDALVRIAGEAVTNAGRHSGAARVSLELEPDGPRMRLRISDRGRGFDTTVTSGFGLTSMRERALSVGGELQVRSVPGEGSVVEATL